jgi:peroxiredoxin
MMIFQKITPPQEGKPLPEFRLETLEGKPFLLASQKKQPSVLFFFCGCAACWDVATEWNRLQRSGTLRQQTPRLQTSIIVYVDMSLTSAKAMAQEMNWDRAQATLILDAKNRVRGLYKAEPCPRVFLADDKKILRYSNTHTYDAPQKAPASAIVAFTLDALKKVASPPSKPKES